MRPTLADPRGYNATSPAPAHGRPLRSISRQHVAATGRCRTCTESTSNLSRQQPQYQQPQYQQPTTRLQPAGFQRPFCERTARNHDHCSTLGLRRVTGVARPKRPVVVALLAVRRVLAVPLDRRQPVPRLDGGRVLQPLPAGGGSSADGRAGLKFPWIILAAFTRAAASRRRDRPRLRAGDFRRRAWAGCTIARHVEPDLAAVAAGQHVAQPPRRPRTSDCPAGSQVQGLQHVVFIGRMANDVRIARASRRPSRAVPASTARTGTAPPRRPPRRPAPRPLPPPAVHARREHLRRRQRIEVGRAPDSPLPLEQPLQFGQVGRSQAAAAKRASTASRTARYVCRADDPQTR